MIVGLNHYLLLSAMLFSIGLYGALSKRNAVVILMCIELMLNAVNIMLIGFSRYVAPIAPIGEIASPLTGQVFALFVMTVAAAEAAVGLALVISIYRNRDTVDVGDVDLMKW